MPRLQRERYVASWLRMLAVGEIALARSADKLFKAEGTRAANAYKESPSIPAVEESIKNGLGTWHKVLIAHYAVTVSQFVDYTKELLTGQKQRRLKANFATRIQAFIAEQGITKSRYITETTIDQARQIINDGQANGDGIETIASALEDGIGGVVSDFRARTIARTETHNAATYAMQATAEETRDQTGMTFTRSWIAVEDQRTRPAHAEADGQTVGMDEPFVVDGEELDRPGDSSGSPENIINCRCAIAYHTTDATGNETDTEDTSDGDIGAGGFLSDQS